jgi:hypothetical protein
LVSGDGLTSSASGSHGTRLLPPAPEPLLQSATLDDDDDAALLESPRARFSVSRLRASSSGETLAALVASWTAPDWLSIWLDASSAQSGLGC